jgi:dTDP-6-deoxy-L-talose 4-dehydrogenase (NAD+)
VNATKKRVLVTGAGGYIGRHVVTALLDAGADVVAIDRSPARRRLDDRAEVVSIDIFDHDTNVFELTGRPDVVVHLAWEAGFIHSSPVHMQRLSAHYAFLTDLADAGIKQIVGLGTMHEVGYFEGELVEDVETNPSSLYGVAKDALRRSLSTYLAGTDVAFQWLRCFYIYGDDEHSRSVFGHLSRAAQSGAEVFPFTWGTKKFDFISVEGLARQIALASLQTEVQGIINCGSGTPTELRVQVERFISENGLDIRLEYGAHPDRASDSPAIWANVDKIRTIVSRANADASA